MPYMLLRPDQHSLPESSGEPLRIHRTLEFVSLAAIGLENRVIGDLAADTTLATAEVRTAVAGPKV